MKTTTLFSIILFLVSFIACDSAVDTPVEQRAGKGSTFTFEQREFNKDNAQTESKLTTVTIDSDQIALESRTDVMRATSDVDTVLFIRDADRSLLLYRPTIALFEGISLPKRWQAILKEHTTDVVEISTYSGTADLDGMQANITIRETEQYRGTMTVTVNGKPFEVIRKSFSTEVIVHIPAFGVTVTSTVTDTYGFAPALGFLVSSEQTRSTDSDFSPIKPGRTDLTLTSYTLKP